MLPEHHRPASSPRCRPSWAEIYLAVLVARLVGLHIVHAQVKDRDARAAKDNVASLRVLEKRGFTICGNDKAFANARGEEVEEAILELR